MSLAAVLSLAGAALTAPPTAALGDGDLTSLSVAEINQDIGADVLHDQGLTGSGVDVALIDSGVEPVPGLDGTGKIVVGPDLSFEAGVDDLYGRDTYGHGTVMASIIAGDDGTDGSSGGFTGVAPGARIVSLKVADNTGATDVSQVIAAVDWVVEHGRDNGLNVRVINLSYRTDASQDPDHDPLVAAVERAWAAGYVVVASAGNDGTDASRIGYPAISPYVIAVASSSETEAGIDVSTYTSSGGDVRSPDLTAPGEKVLGLAAPDSRLVQEHPDAVIDGRYLRGSGTSQAAAVVSGAAALLIEADPSLTPDQVKAALVLGTDSATDRDQSAIEASELGQFYDDLATWQSKLDKQSQKLADAVANGAKQRKINKIQVKVDKALEERDKAAHKLDDEIESQLGNWKANEIGKIVLDPRHGSGWLDVERSRSLGALNGVQDHGYSDGQGTLEGSRGTSHVVFPDGSLLTGETTFTGSSWSGSSWSGSSWSGSSWSGSSWSGSSWSGSSWSGSSWSGSSWSGSSWSGSSWSGSSWSGSSWSGSSWSGSSWSGSSWSGSSWSGSSWSGSDWA